MSKVFIDTNILLYSMDKFGKALCLEHQKQQKNYKKPEKDLDALYELLINQYKIDYLIDIRSKPYSKYNSEFNQNELKHILKKNKRM